MSQTSKRVFTRDRQTPEADVRLNNLLCAVVGRIDEHAEGWEKAKAAGETLVMGRYEGKMREARRISEMIGELIQQST